MTPDQQLHDCIRRGETEGVSRALAAGANLNAEDATGDRPIDSVLELDDPAVRYEIAVMVLTAGADPNVPQGWSPFRLVVAFADVALVRLFLRHGATVAATFDGDSTALHEAAEDGHLEVVKAMIEEGDGRQWLDSYDYIERTPLACAAHKHHEHVVRYLIDAGSDVNANYEERIGETALARAVMEDAPYPIVEALIDAGADPRIPGWMHLTAVYRAQQRAKREGATEEDARILALLEQVAERLDSEPSD